MTNYPLKTSDYSLQYGALLGVISVVFALMLFFLDQHYQGGTAVNVVNTVIMVSVIVLGQYAYKKANSNYLSLAEGLKIGLGISLISALISVAYYFILVNFLDPDTMEKALLLAQDKMIEVNPKLTQKELDDIAEISRKFSGPGVTSTFILIFNLFFGFIISLISGLIIKKSKPE